MRKSPVKSLMAMSLASAMVLGGVLAPISAEAAAPVAPSKIVLSATSKTMYVGQSSTLKVKSVSPSKASKAVTFKSSDGKVVVVNSKGKLTAKKAGKATITVTSKLKKNGKAAKATCKITVQKAPTKLKLAVSSKTMVVGNTFTLKTVMDKTAFQGVKYTSNKTSVATVSSKGVVSAKKAGKAVITVTSVANAKAKATFTVTVKKAPTKIVLGETSKSIAVGKTYSLKVKSVLPGDAIKDLKYTTNNAKVAVVSAKGVVTGKSKGTASITVSSVAKPNVKAKCTVKVWNAPKSITAASTVDLYAGEKSAVKVTLPAGTYTGLDFKTADAKVATVSSNGVVTAVGKGSTSLVIMSKLDSKVRKVVKINVTPKAESITLNYNSKTMGIGDTFKLVAKSMAPAGTDGKVAFKSDDKTIAGVKSDGTVTGYKEGTTYINVIAKSNTEVVARCKVTILPKVVDAVTETEGFKYYTLDKLAKKYAVEYKGVESEVDAKDFAADVQNMKDSWNLYYNSDKTVKELFDGAAFDAFIEAFLSAKSQDAMSKFVEFKITKNEDGVRVVNAKRATGTWDVTATVSAVENEDKTTDIIIDQVGGRERKYVFKNVVRTLVEDNNVITFTVGSYDLVVTINKDASLIDIKRQFANSTVDVLTYEETKRAYTLKVNKTYAAEISEKLGLAFDIDEVKVSNLN